MGRNRKSSFRGKSSIPYVGATPEEVEAASSEPTGLGWGAVDLSPISDEIRQYEMYVLEKKDGGKILVVGIYEAQNQSAIKAIEDVADFKFSQRKCQRTQQNGATSVFQTNLTHAQASGFEREIPQRNIIRRKMDAAQIDGFIEAKFGVKVSQTRSR